MQPCEGKSSTISWLQPLPSPGVSPPAAQVSWHAWGELWVQHFVRSLSTLLNGQTARLVEMSPSCLCDCQPRTRFCSTVSHTLRIVAADHAALPPVAGNFADIRGK